MKHMLHKNICLITTRITKDELSNFISDKICAHKYASRYDIIYVFPLYRYLTLDSGDAHKILEKDTGWAENISSSFRAYLDALYDNHYTPEDIIGYIYSVLYAPTYRGRYAEFLRTEFARVPFPESAADFERLSHLGWALVQAHLVQHIPRRGLALYSGRGNHEVEFVSYSAADLSIAINKAQSFKPVPQAAWDFCIGGHQVLDKYLKSRKDRKLSLDEIDHVAKVADSLAFTSTRWRGSTRPIAPLFREWG